MKRKLIGACLAMALVLGLFAGLPGTVRAAGKGVTQLKPGKTVTTTLTGSKKHKVWYTQSGKGTDHYKMTLYIGGKAEYTYKSSGCDVACANVWLLKVSSSTTLIYVNFSAEDMDMHVNKVFCYSSGMLTLCGSIGKILMAPVPVSAGQNNFTINIMRQDASVGSYFMDVLFNYTSAKQKISIASNTYKVFLYTFSAPAGEFGGWKNNWGTVARKFKTYTKAGGSTLSFTAQKGDRLRVEKVHFANDVVFFQVKNQRGKTGWFKDPKKYMQTGYFLEAVFGG